MSETHTAESVSAKFKEAGTALFTLWAGGGVPAGHWSTKPVFARVLQCVDGQGQDFLGELPNDMQSASVMDRTYSWLRLLPGARRGLARFVVMRSLTHPATDRPVWTWREIGARCGCSHVSAVRWHTEGVTRIAERLNRPGLCAATGGPIGSDLPSSGAAAKRRALHFRQLEQA